MPDDYPTTPAELYPPLESQAVRLRNGSEEFGPLVRMCWISLQALMQDDTVAFFELVECARDRNHKPFGKTGEALAGLGMLESTRGAMHSSIRNIVLSSVRGEGLEMTLCNPIAPA